MTKRKLALFALCLTICLGPALAQSATPHGIVLTWTASTVAAGEPALAGYNIYRNGVKLNTAPVLATTYEDPNSDLVAGTTYAYAVTAIDVQGNESGLSNVASVTPAVLIVNPPAPSGCNAKQQ